MNRTRQEQAEWRRERLLDAALEVFADKGIDGASVKDVTKAAGVTAGLLYHYFDGKEALVQALLAERGFLPRLRELLSRPDDQRPAVEVLAELLGEFDRLLADNTELVALFFGSVQAREALGAFVAEGQGLIGEFLADRVRAGELRSHDTRTAATVLFATIAVGRRTGSPVDVTNLIELLFPKEGRRQ